MHAKNTFVNDENSSSKYISFLWLSTVTSCIPMNRWWSGEVWWIFVFLSFIYLFTLFMLHVFIPSSINVCCIDFFVKFLERKVIDTKRLFFFSHDTSVCGRGSSFSQNNFSFFKVLTGAHMIICSYFIFKTGISKQSIAYWMCFFTTFL